MRQPECASIDTHRRREQLPDRGGALLIEVRLMHDAVDTLGIVIRFPHVQGYLPRQRAAFFEQSHARPE